MTSTTPLLSPRPVSLDTLFDPVGHAEAAQAQNLPKLPGGTYLNYSDPHFDHVCVHDLFSHQARKTPNAIAICDPYNLGEGQQKHEQSQPSKYEWTYQEIDDITDRLACYMVRHYDVKPDAVVGILLPRSCLYVIAYISILKAGGAYMPLELVYPKQLLEQATEQTNAKLVVTTPIYADRIASQPHLAFESVTALSEFLAAAEEQEKEQEDDQVTTTLTSTRNKAFLWANRPTADHLAFVVMSSGTTGTPKGICQVHRAAVHAYTDRLVRFPYTKDEQTGIVQDRGGAGVFFSWECYRPLGGGATCVVIPDHFLFDPKSVTKFVKVHQITRMLVTPSLLQLIWNSIEPKVLQKNWASLRYLWYCGEVVSMPLATAFCELFPKNLRFLNLYSISECHDVSIGDLNEEVAALTSLAAAASDEKKLDVNATAKNASTESTNGTKYATCGYAIPGVQMYIVDLEEDHDDANAMTNKTLKLVSPGETGEVYVGGPGMGRGYLHMPEKTKERFVPNPFDSTGRFPTLYRTGDLGRITESPDPNTGPQLEILGRCDFMVKLRGYSVVLGAIETALSKHPQLSSAVVLAVGQEGSMDKQLVAYVVPKQWDNPPSAASVRSFLKHHVPPYAIPSTFCVLNALPVHASAAGKVDRKKLPPVESATRLRAFSVDVQDEEEEKDVTQQPSDTSAEVGVPVQVQDPVTAATTASILPAPPSQAATRLAPQTPTELIVLQVWADLLEMPARDFSALDSFFEVGGHSLLATRMVSTLNDQLGKKKEDQNVGADLIDNNNKNSAEQEADDDDDDDDESLQVITIVDVVQGPTIREIAAKIDGNLGVPSSLLDSSLQQLEGINVSKQEKVDLMAEAEALDPSIYPFATRKGEAMSRFRPEGSTLLPPSIVFLTGATGYLGVHILADLLLHHEELIVVCLVRAKNDELAKTRVMGMLEQFGLDNALDQKQQQEQQDEARSGGANENSSRADWHSRFMGVAGDLSQPLLGMDSANFKSLAVEIDSIIHCGALVNLVQPYQALKAANVLGTQEILRLATTNGFVKTKVKPVHYISTNGIFSVSPKAYNTDGDKKIHVCPEDIDLKDETVYNDFLTEGYGMTKWVAEQMCTIAESRGLPVSVMRPGNMGPCTYTTSLNKDDFVVLLVQGMIEMGCAPDSDTTLYAVDWTPVDFAARAVVQLAVHAPTRAIGQRMHLQTSRDPIFLSTIVSWLRESGHQLESVSRKEWMLRLHRAAGQERQEAASASSTVLQRLESGWDAFEPYFKASTWLRYGNKNLQNALQGTGSDIEACNPRMDQELFAKWFPTDGVATPSSPTTVMNPEQPSVLSQ